MDMRSIIPWGRERSMPAPRWNDDGTPFVALHRQMDRLFDDFFRDLATPATRAGWGGMGQQWPHIAVSETEKQVMVTAELPGMTVKDVELTLTEGVLCLKGEKKSETSDKVYSEIWHGSFERMLEVGDVDPDKVQANFKDGVLTVTLEKRPEAQAPSHRIPITDGHG